MIRATTADCVGTDVSKVGQMLEHSLGGGKGLRALVAHISCDWCGMAREQCNEVAAAMEMIHLAALLHDDIVDDATKRRDKSSANHEFGSDAAVLAGDFLYSRASQMLCSVGNINLLSEVADATNTLAEGEVMQLVNKDSLPSRDEYYETIKRKTAALFSACAISGAVTKGMEEMVEPMRRYGLNLGQAFQITDDCIDFTGDEKRTGKRPGMDFHEGKATLPLIIGMDMAKGRDRKKLDALRSDHDKDGAFQQVRALLGDLGAIDQAHVEAKQRSEAALSALTELPGNDFSLMLSTLADKAVNRTH